MRKIKVFSVCSGVGGLDKPFSDDARFEIIGFSENDPHASAVLKYHYPGVKNYGDLTKIRIEELPDFDLLVGGTPCNNFSIAGNREGLAGIKSGLFYTYAKILKIKQPSYFIWENVKGCLNSNGGWDFAKVQIEFAESGYSFRWELLNGKDFGIPQNRERVFTVGCLGTKRGREILSRPKNLRQDSQVKSNERKSAKRTFSHSGGEIGRILDGGLDADRKRPSLSFLAWSSSGRDWGREERVTVGHAHTLNTGDGCRTQSACNYILVTDPVTGISRLRKLIPLECERLMGWPDNHTQIGTYEEKDKNISDNQRYKQCGNGVIPQMVEPIRDLILEMEAHG